MWFRSLLLLGLVLFADMVASKAHDQHIRMTKHSAAGRSLRAERPMATGLALARGAGKDHSLGRSLMDHLPENADALPGRRDIQENPMDSFMNPEVRSSGRRSATRGASVVCDGKDPKAPKCPSSLTCCKRSCQNLQYNNANCGRCGKRCGPYQSCCAGVCSNFLSDARNCGRCGVRCKAGATCFQSMCNYAA